MCVCVCVVISIIRHPMETIDPKTTRSDVISVEQKKLKPKIPVPLSVRD